MIDWSSSLSDSRGAGPFGGVRRNEAVDSYGARERATNLLPPFAPELPGLRRPLGADFMGEEWRPRPESNRGTRICRPFSSMAADITQTLAFSDKVMLLRLDFDCSCAPICALRPLIWLASLQCGRHSPGLLRPPDEAARPLRRHNAARSLARWNGRATG